MRFLIICFLFSALLSAQSGQDYGFRYVWAESGLTMRTGPTINAEKSAVIPYGAKIQLTGKAGTPTEIRVLPAVTYDWNEEQRGTSEAYVMREPFFEVVCGKDTGYVYGGYLSHYPPAEAGEIQLNKWLARVSGAKPDTIWDGVPMHGLTRHQTTLHYRNGIIVKHQEMEGGGESTYLFPLGNRNEGYLIAARFFGITYAADNEEEANLTGDFLPELLTIQENGDLHFNGDRSETTISIVGGFLIITSGGWC